MRTILSVERPISVYVLVETRLVREALVRLARKQMSLEVVGASGDVRVAWEQLAARPCDVLLLDSLQMLRSFLISSGTSNREAGGKILLLGMEQDPEHFLQAVGLGIRGYLLKDVSTAEVLDAVQATAQGQAVCPPKLCKTLFDFVATGMASRSGSPEQTGNRQVSLTVRQRQLMKLVAGGMTNKEIASNLNLSEFTVKNHIRRVMAHLHADSRHKAVETIRAGGFFPGA
ncbi:MAG TPA: response regulator transcription factor [Candidatus Sulfotelmatobacter sp.]|nr:response regulator transcription factor [Candidatus Sulfotelmatobacter sp.]